MPRLAATRQAVWPGCEGSEANMRGLSGEGAQRPYKSCGLLFQRDKTGNLGF